jgi:hypothetical protein
VGADGELDHRSASAREAWPLAVHGIRMYHLRGQSRAFISDLHVHVNFSRIADGWCESIMPKQDDGNNLHSHTCPHTRAAAKSHL